MARYEATEYDVRGTTVAVQRGQFFASPDEMATAWNWSRSAVNRFLTRLKSEHMIEQSTGHKKTLITICNYELYQANDDQPGHTTEQSTGHKADTKRTVKKKGKKGTKEDTNVSSARKRKTRIPEDAIISAPQMRSAEKRNLSQAEAEAQFQRFKNNALAKGLTFLDWDRAFVTWLDSPYFKTITTINGGRNDTPKPDPTLDAIAQAARMRRSPGAHRG